MSTNRTLAPTPVPPATLDDVKAAILIIDQPRPDDASMLRDASAWPDEGLTAEDRKALARAEFDHPTGHFRPVEKVTITAESGSWADPGPKGGSLQPYLAYRNRRDPQAASTSSRAVFYVMAAAVFLLLAVVGSSVWLVAHAHHG